MGLEALKVLTMVIGNCLSAIIPKIQDKPTRTALKMRAA